MSDDRFQSASPLSICGARYSHYSRIAETRIVPTCATLVLIFIPAERCTVSSRTFFHSTFTPGDSGVPPLATRALPASLSLTSACERTETWVEEEVIAPQSRMKTTVTCGPLGFSSDCTISLSHSNIGVHPKKRRRANAPTQILVNRDGSDWLLLIGLRRKSLPSDYSASRTVRT
jgi:hypothetical protein